LNSIPPPDLAGQDVSGPALTGHDAYMTAFESRLVLFIGIFVDRWAEPTVNGIVHGQPIPLQIFSILKTSAYFRIALLGQPRNIGIW